MDTDERLHRLLIALFDDPQELERSLVLQGIPLIRSGGANIAAYASRVVDRLRSDPALHERLFEALAAVVPERADDVAAVQKYYRHVRAAERHQPSADQDEFTTSLRTALAAVEPPDESRALDDQHLPWTAAACVLGSFWPTGLHPLPGSGSSHTSALTALAGFVHVDFAGHWSLRDDVRRECLSALHELNQLDQALQANAGLKDNKRDMFAELLHHGLPTRLAELSTDELDEYSTVLDWMEPVGLVPAPVRVVVQSALERRLVLDPLRALVGRHFSGRDDEVRLLEDHVHGRTQRPIMVVQGAGGAGKSTVLGRVLLELERQADRVPISFAYIDFDRPTNDPRQWERLLAHISRQLRLLHSLDDDARAFSSLESTYSGIDRKAQKVSPLVGLEELAERLRQVRRGNAPALVLVLDTFEEVQARGPGAVEDVLYLVETLRLRIPSIKVIVAGRGSQQVVFPRAGTEAVLDLGELDADIAEEVLAHLGVEEPALRAAIVEKFGGNPLTLRLAAQAMRNASVDGIEPAGQAEALTEAAADMVQGMLYGRILSHIADPEVVRVAYPGLAVRRVTVGVLRDVLAEPCGLDPACAREIFAKLQREVSMFDREGGALRHRQDVRRLMLRTMLDDPGRAATVARIHQLAIAYYRRQTGLGSRAEELYHLLMSDQDPRGFSKLWTDELRSLLEPALSEPLPARARRWLERRLGRTSGDDRTEWDQEDWEAEAASRAASWLASGKPDRALEVLAERHERLPGSRLFAAEVNARLELGDIGGAEGVLRHGIESAQNSGDRRTQEQLSECAVQVYVARNDPRGVETAARWAARSCDMLGQPDRGVDVLAFAVRALNGAPTGLGEELSARFVRLSRQVLREQPDLVCRVLHAAGETEPALLHHAAAEVGEPEHKVFRSDAFVLDRLLARVTPESLAELATQLGMRASTTTEISGQAVHMGRAGHVVSFVLDHTSDPVQARQMVVQGLVRFVVPLFPRSAP